MLVPVDTKLLLLAVVLRDFPDRTRTRPRAFATIVRIVRVLVARESLRAPGPNHLAL